MTEELPAPPAAPPNGAQVIADFQVFLRSLTPRVWLVPAIVVLNVAVFGLMVVSGVDAFAPGVELLRWGANFGPKTLAGEPWRLVASAFLHFGAVHLAMNMVALWDAGRLVERIFGHARFAAVYLVAAACGSITSLVVHPQVVSAGASGAVFGVYGALAGFLVRERSAIPARVLSKLRGVALGFVGYNLVFGFLRPNIDVAAHLGGALSGAIAGVYLSRPLVPGRKDSGRNVVLLAAAAFAVVAITYTLVPPFGHARLATNQLPGFTIELPSGEVVEDAGEYRIGRRFLRGAGDGWSVAGVAWQPGTVSRAVLEPIAKGLGAKLGVAGASTIVTFPGPAGSTVDTVEVRGENGTMWFSALDCGKRSVIVATIGATAAIHRRVLLTFACQADQSLDAVVGVVPVKLELPGWSALSRDEGQLVLSDGRSTLLVRSWMVPTRTSLSEVASTVFAGMGAQVEVTPASGDVVSVRGSLGAVHVDGWARALRCPTTGVLLMLLAPDKATADSIGSLTAQARCTLDGEAPSSWPNASGPGRAR